MFPFYQFVKCLDSMQCLSQMCLQIHEEYDVVVGYQVERVLGCLCVPLLHVQLDMVMNKQDMMLFLMVEEMQEK